MKKLYVYENEEKFGSNTFFFDETSLITSFSGNDANYRDEYMNSIFAHFKIEVNRVSKLNPAQKKQLTAHCKECGINIYKKEKEATVKNFDYFAVRLDSPFGYQDVVFLVNRNLSFAEELLKLSLTNYKIKDREFQGCSGVSFFFEKDAIELTKECDVNYRTSRGDLAYFNLVEKIVLPKDVVISEKYKKTYKLKNWNTFEDVSDELNYSWYVSEANCFQIKK